MDRDALEVRLIKSQHVSNQVRHAWQDVDIVDDGQRDPVGRLQDFAGRRQHGHALAALVQLGVTTFLHGCGQTDQRWLMNLDLAAKGFGLMEHSERHCNSRGKRAMHVRLIHK